MSVISQLKIILKKCNAAPKMGRFKMNLRHKEMFPECSSVESSACTVTCAKEPRGCLCLSWALLVAEGILHAGPCLFTRLQPAAQELIRSVLSGLRKPSSVANPWAAGDPGVAEWQPPAASPGQPASCLQAPWLAGAGLGVGWAGSGGPPQLVCHSH